MKFRQLLSALAFGLAATVAAEWQSPALAPEALQFSDRGTIVQLSDFRQEISLNGVWQFLPPETRAQPFNDADELVTIWQNMTAREPEWSEIVVPRDFFLDHPQARNPEQPFVRTFYAREFELSREQLQQRRVLLHFGAVGYEAALAVNGQFAGEHRGDFTDWQIDITPWLQAGTNRITLRVLTDQGPFSQTTFPLTHAYGSQWAPDNIKGGIWQDVSLRIVPEVYTQFVQITPRFAERCIQVDYEIVNATPEACQVELLCGVRSAMVAGERAPIGRAATTLSLTPGIQRGTLSIPLENPLPWTPETPNLYFLTVQLADRDLAVERFGFREFKTEGRNFYLNGERIYLFGENLQSRSFGGTAIGPDAERESALKNLLGFRASGYNILRNAHMPIDPVVLRLADEIGLMFYNEWAWCFSTALDFEKFRENNLRELEEWFRRDTNHASVVMWSLGNEINLHADNRLDAEIQAGYDRMRALDRQKRPLVSFSGNAGFDAFGKRPTATDVADLHCYLGLGSAAWTTWNRKLHEFYMPEYAALYSADRQFKMPYIVWECIGFSWGDRSDAGFDTADIEQVKRYVEQPTSWGSPNGIGFAGTIGLSASLDPARGADYGQRYLGRRIAEEIRLDPEIAGFAPWMHRYDLAEAQIWTQKLYPALRTGQNLPVGDLFINDNLLNFVAINSSNEAIDNAQILLSVDGDTVAALDAVSIAPWQRVELPVTVNFKRSGAIRLEVEVRVAGRSISRNHYDLTIFDRNAAAAPIPKPCRVGLIDNDSAAAHKFKAILQELNIPYTPIRNGNFNGFELLIQAPADERTGWNPENSAALRTAVEAGARLLILEQSNSENTAGEFGGVNVQENSFVEILDAKHPIFIGLTQANFDNWSQLPFGFVVRNAGMAFNENALMLRGPFLHDTKSFNAVSEGSLGAGRILRSQLELTAGWGNTPGAMIFLRNLIMYMMQPDGYGKIRPWQMPQNLLGGDPKRQESVDLRAFFNRSFRDETPGDGTGGWSDQGENDFRDMPLGRQSVGDVRFQLVDPAENMQKSCLVLRGPGNESLPERVEGIPVDASIDKLYILHAAGWMPNSGVIGEYRIHYQDGSSALLPMTANRNIGDWWSAEDLPEAIAALKTINPRARNCAVFATRWDNPHPERPVVSIDVVSNGVALPILLGMTIEKCAPL